MEKKDGAAADGGAKVAEIGKEAGDSGVKVPEFVKDATKEAIGKVVERDGEARNGGVKVPEFVKDATKEVIGKEVQRNEKSPKEKEEQVDKSSEKEETVEEGREKKEETVDKIGERKEVKVEKSSVKQEDMEISSAKTILKKEEKATDENAREGFVKTVRKVNFNDKEEVYNVHIETDDCSNDTDLVIDESDFPLSENNSTEDSDDDSYIDIPLSQIKNDERMVRYRESLQHDTESDEFSLGTEGDNTKEEAEVVKEIIQALDDSIKSVQNREITDATKEVSVDTSARKDGVGKTDEHG